MQQPFRSDPARHLLFGAVKEISARHPSAVLAHHLHYANPAAYREVLQGAVCRRSAAIGHSGDCVLRMSLNEQFIIRQRSQKHQDGFLQYGQ
jgi:hypothetical protein